MILNITYTILHIWTDVTRKIIYNCTTVQLFVVWTDYYIVINIMNEWRFTLIIYGSADWL